MELCQDEGCPQSHIKHVCVDSVRNGFEPSKQTAQLIMADQPLTTVRFETPEGVHIREYLKEFYTDAEIDTFKRGYSIIESAKKNLGI